MSKTLLDIDNLIIPIPLPLIEKSKVLKSFFESDPDKAFKLEYPFEIISNMLAVMRNDDNLVITDILIDLCHQLEISDIDNLIDNLKDIYVEEQIPTNQSFYVYNHIFLEANEQYITKKITKNREQSIILTLKNGSKYSSNNLYDINIMFRNEYPNNRAAKQPVERSINNCAK